MDSVHQLTAGYDSVSLIPKIRDPSMIEGHSITSTVRHSYLLFYAKCVEFNALVGSISLFLI